MEPINALLIGLPETGKTTFLAALWHVVESGEVQSSLKLENLHGNRDHLNLIRSEWSSCKPLSRTGITSEKLVSMLLTDPETGKTTEVYFPDMSGESFHLQWKTRKWTKEYDDIVIKASGALLFIHPNMVREPIRIDYASQFVDIIGKSESPPEGSSPESEIPWDPGFAPTQVELVDLLQFHKSRLIDRASFRIGLIISAWDLIKDQNPEDWLRKRLSLLDQYLKANQEYFILRIYGVSAQGGDLPKESDRLCEAIRPSDRIIVVGQDCGSHDITAPVKWVMG
jgi:hypothetical protein